MANKQLTFSAKLDDKEFLEALRKIQGKVKELYSPVSSNVAFQSAQEKLRKIGIVGPSKEEEDRTRRFNDLQKKSQTELVDLMRKQWDIATKLDKIADARQKKLEDLIKKQGEAKEGSEEELEIKEKILETENKINKTYEKRNEAATKAKETAEAYEAKPASLLDRMGGKMGVTLGAIGLAAKAYSLYREIGAQNVDFAQQVKRATGTLATEGPSGQMMKSIYRGQASDLFFESKERAAAAASAMDRLRVQKELYTPSKIISDIGSRGFYGQMMGAATGAFFGGVGAAPGSLMGAAAGIGSGIYDVLTDPMKRKAFTSPGEVRKILAGEAVKNYEEMIETEKRQDPLKFLAREEYKRTGTENLQFQRLLGLSDESFYGAKGAPGTGFLGGALSRGYTREEILGAGQGILAAGGSTRSARENAELAVQMQRAGMQNATGIVGQLSRTMGSADTTQSATIRIMAEGVKKGLDTSEYRQENNKFLEVVTRAVSLSGTTTREGAESLAAYAGQFLTGKTMAAVEAVPTAMEFVKGLQTSAGTPESVVKASKIMSSKEFSKLPMMMKEELAYGDPMELSDPTNPKVVKMADAAGMDVKDFISTYKKLNKESVLSTRPIQEISDVVSKKRRELMAGGHTAEEAMSILETTGDYGALEMGIGHEKGAAWRAMSREQKKAVMGYLTSPEGEGMSIEQAMEKAKTGITTKPGEQRLGQTELEGLAKQQGIVNENFKSMKGEMENVATAAKNLSEEMMRAAIKMQQAIEEVKSGKKGADEYLESAFKEATKLFSTGTKKPTAGAPRGK